MVPVTAGLQQTHTPAVIIYITVCYECRTTQTSPFMDQAVPPTVIRVITLVLKFILKWKLIMAKFEIHASKPDGSTTVLYYDNMTSILTWEDGTKVIDQPSQQNGYGKITKNNNSIFIVNNIWDICCIIFFVFFT